MDEYESSIIFCFLLSLVEIFGDFSLKKFAYTNQIPYLGMGFVFYLGVIYFFIQSVRNSTVLVVNNLWDGLSSLIESLAEMIFLGERMDHWIQYMGIIFIIVGIYCIRYQKRK